MNPNIIKSFVVLMLLVSVSASGQSNSKLSVGIVGGIAAYTGDFTDHKDGLRYPDFYGLDFGFQLYLPIREKYMMGLSYAFSNLQGDESTIPIVSTANPNFTTGMNKIGLSGEYHLWQLYEEKKWSPYFSVEASYLIYSPKYAPNPSDPDILNPIYSSSGSITKSGFAYGTELGVRFILSNEFYLQTSTQIIWRVPKDVDGIISDTFDRYQRLNIGIFYHFNREDSHGSGGKAHCYEF